MSEEKNNISLIEQKDENLTQESNAGTDITIKKSTYNKMVKGIIAAIAIATFFGGYSLGTMSDSGSDISTEELKEILSEIEIKTAPTPQPARQPTQPSAPQIFKVSLDDDPVMGNPNAPVTVVEFSDFQCPFCKRFFDQTLPLIEENYINTGKVKLVYKDLPLVTLHPNVKPVHVAAECADEQGKFWGYHDALFEKQSEWQSLSPSDLQTTLVQYADDFGLQIASFEACLNSPEMLEEVNADFLQAASYGATGTPTFFIGNEKDGFIKLVGAQPYATFQRVLDNLLG